MKNILLFGAGKSATVLIDYLLQNAARESWQITVVDASLELAQSKIDNSLNGHAVSFDINDVTERKNYIREADIVISLLPPALHILVARDCVVLCKNLLTASYADEQMKALKDDIETRGLLFLCEMGLDPGIDHMSAMKLIDNIRARNGRVTSFQSHCGGLVAPESDDNPWRYKISWNPRSVVLAGKGGAHFRKDGEEHRLSYLELFNEVRAIAIPGLGPMNWYPNRDSLTYAPLYGLEDADTFIRTTLRYSDFIIGWKNILELKLTDETPQYKTDGKPLAEVFKEHMKANGFEDWLQQKMIERFTETKDILGNLVRLMQAEQAVNQEQSELPTEFMSVDEHGKINEFAVDEVKNKAAGFLAEKMRETNLTVQQLVFLGLDDKKTIVNKGLISAADLLQFAMEKKLALRADDKDMIVMMHELSYVIDRHNETVRSVLIVKGENNVRTAMAKTVGLPLGIATRLILNGTIQLRGLHIPTQREIYEPVLAELENHGVSFIEENSSTEMQ